MKTKRLAGFFMLIGILLSLTGCAEGTTEADIAATERQVSSDLDLKRAQQDEYDDRAAEFEATSRAKYDEEMESEAWHEHLEEVEAAGEDEANDPSINQDPGVYDCEDFMFIKEAIAFYWGAGGPKVDVFWLDDDNDEVPCELLPRWDSDAEWYTNLP